jgi:uncharacterized membrane protein
MAAHPDHSAHIKSVELERVVFFSDAVFAIAITLLVLELRMPERIAGDPDRQLAHGLIGLIPKFISYAISFWLIGLYWWVHHRLYRHIRRWDDGLIWLNLHFLFWVAFLPFPVALVGSWGDRRGAVIFYAATLLMMGIAQALLWRHASRGNRLIDPNFDPEYARYISVRSWIAPLATLSVLLIAFWNPRFSWFGFWLIFLGQAMHRRRHKAMLARVGASG